MVITWYGLAQAIWEEASQIGGVISEFASRAEGVDMQDSADSHPPALDRLSRGLDQYQLFPLISVGGARRRATAGVGV